MIETGEWKGTYYAWEHTEFGFAMAVKSTESEMDARAKLEAGDGKCIFVGMAEPLETRYYEEGGFVHMEYVDYPGVCPIFVEDKFARTVAKRLEDEE